MIVFFLFTWSMEKIRQMKPRSRINAYRRGEKWIEESEVTRVMCEKNQSIFMFF